MDNSYPARCTVCGRFESNEPMFEADTTNTLCGQLMNTEYAVSVCIDCNEDLINTARIERNNEEEREQRERAEREQELRVWHDSVR